MAWVISLLAVRRLFALDSASFGRLDINALG
jgi:hypothetical protein